MPTNANPCAVFLAPHNSSSPPRPACGQDFVRKPAAAARLVIVRLKPRVKWGRNCDLEAFNLTRSAWRGACPVLAVGADHSLILPDRAPSASLTCHPGLAEPGSFSQQKIVLSEFFNS
jgi:hypothetical protein